MHEVSSKISSDITSLKLTADPVKDLSNLSTTACSRSSKGFLHHCECTLLNQLLATDVVKVIATMFAL